jgi:hypothetical protein
MDRFRVFFLQLTITLLLVHENREREALDFESPGVFGCPRGAEDALARTSQRNQGESP